ncbi:MAG: hypothetical protein IIX19_04955, partial [Alistipes sp.]|nr:hypothetical protein [Alistipes sp.]
SGIRRNACDMIDLIILFDFFKVNGVEKKFHFETPFALQTVLIIVRAQDFVNEFSLYQRWPLITKNRGNQKGFVQHTTSTVAVVVTKLAPIQVDAPFATTFRLPPNLKLLT